MGMGSPTVVVAMQVLMEKSHQHGKAHTPLGSDLHVMTRPHVIMWPLWSPSLGVMLPIPSELQWNSFTKGHWGPPQACRPRGCFG